VVVLKGDGITIEETGTTLIRHGVTSATFSSIPDVAFESIEVSLPAGRYSEFGANLPHGSYDFCGQKLSMPTEFKGQNGLEIHQNTPVAITGCPKAKKLTRAQKLTAALKACKKKHSKRKRAACARAARKKYGPLGKKGKKGKKAKQAARAAATGVGHAVTAAFDGASTWLDEVLTVREASNDRRANS
jgi:hypothetical protein